MKKYLLIFLLFGCAKETPPTPAAIITHCYHCTQKIVTTISPSITGYPKTDYSYYDQCGWYDADARNYEAKSTTTIKTTTGSYTITSKSTCACVIK